jgi:serine/threonine protein kinase
MYEDCKNIAKNLETECGSVMFNTYMCKLLADIYSLSIADLDNSYLRGRDERELESDLHMCHEAVAEMKRVMLCGQILARDWTKQEWWKSVIHSSDSKCVKIRVVLHLKEFLNCVKAFKVRIAEARGYERFDLPTVEGLENWESDVEEASRKDTDFLLQKAKMYSKKSSFLAIESPTCKIAKHLLAMFTPNSNSDGEHLHSIRYNDVQIKEPLGNGSFGNVFKCKFLGVPAAAKVFKTQDSNTVKQEVTILANLQHPNVLQFIGLARNQNQYVLVTELMGMDLRSYLDQKIVKDAETPPLTLLEAIDIMLQVAEGMDYLHARGVMHRDLKSPNVLINVLDYGQSQVSKSVRAKLADFGVSKLKDSSTFTTPDVGTTLWRAPEVFTKGSGEKYRKSADVYSFAIIFFEVLTGKTPFDGVRRQTFYEHIRSGERPALPPTSYCPEYLSALIQRCWATRAEARPTFREICQMLEYCKGILVRKEFPSYMQCIRACDADQLKSKGLTVYFHNRFTFKRVCEETLFKLWNNGVSRVLLLLMFTFVLWSVFYLQMIRDTLISFLTAVLSDHLVLSFSKFLSSSLQVHHFVSVSITSSLQATPSFVLHFCSSLLSFVLLFCSSLLSFVLHFCSSLLSFVLFFCSSLLSCLLVIISFISYPIATLLFLLIFYASFRRISQFIASKYSSSLPQKNSFLDAIGLPSFVFTMILLLYPLFFQSFNIHWLVFNLVFKLSQFLVVVTAIIVAIIMTIVLFPS